MAVLKSKIDEIAALASEAVDRNQLELHIEELRAALEAVPPGKNRARRQSEIEGEIEATLYMLQHFPTLGMAHGYERIGATGIDQIWVGPKNKDGCPDPIVIVEAKGGNAVLNQAPVYKKRFEGAKGCKQMDKNWVAVDAARLGNRDPEKYKKQDYQYHSGCIAMGLEEGSPCIYGVVIRGGKPCEYDEYKDCELELITACEMPFKESKSNGLAPTMLKYQPGKDKMRQMKRATSK